MFTGARNPEPFLAIAVVVFAVAVALFRFRCFEIPLVRLARKKSLAICVAALSPLFLRVLLLLWFPTPEPRFHDDFSFLLGADTLAHGRLANPQHPFWMHFESMHILARPVYSTAFPIGQAAALALGKVVFGNPWAGVWLGTAFMCGAICWMLQGWLPPRWALLGALLLVFRLGVSSYWMNTYWGGCLAAGGGALVLGALPRILRAPAWRYAVTMGVGFAILANTRTFEGAILGLAVAVPLLRPLLKEPRRILVPLALVLALTGVGMGFYFSRVTGKPWVAPYVLYRDSVSIAPHFLWQKPTAEPLYNNREVRDFYVHWEMDSYHKAHDHMLEDFWNKVESYWRFYVGPLFTIPLLAVPLLGRNRKIRQALAIGAVFSLSLWGQVWHNPHYAAPVTGLVMLIVVLGLRRLMLWKWRGLPVGLNVGRMLPWACAAMLMLRISAGPAPSGSAEDASWRWPSQGGAARAKMLSQLESSGGKHLVFVRYRAPHDPGNEWVYNDAEIDASSVVWARELDRASNERLMHYFAGRQVWLVQPDLEQPSAIPYREAPPVAMPFVQLGAPGIEVLQPAEVRRLVSAGHEGERLSCDLWNYAFMQATDVEGPDVSQGCYPGSDRGETVSFEEWLSWLQRQR